MSTPAATIDTKTSADTRAATDKTSAASNTNTDPKAIAEDKTKALVLASEHQLTQIYTNFKSKIIVRDGGKLPSLRRGVGALTQMSDWYYSHGIEYFYGIGRPVDFEIAYSHYFNQESRAGAASADVLYHKGLCLIYQKTRKLEAAFNYFKDAAELGHLDAWVDSAICLENGFGIKANAAQASEIYLKAAEAGEPRAQYFWATILLKRNKKELDELAVQWLEKAVAQHLPAAQWLLGKCYEEGRGIAKDDKEAMELYKRACVSGPKRAIAAFGKQPTQFNTPQAIQWLAKSQEEGDPRAQFEMAMRYKNGKGVVKDLDQAIFRLKTLVDKNLSDTARHLPGPGWYYGRYVELDEIIAKEMIAIEQLGGCYQETWDQASNGKSPGLIPFYYFQKAKSRKIQLNLSRKTNVRAPEERDATTVGKFENPLNKNAQLERLFLILGQYKQNKNLHVVEMTGKDSLVLTDQHDFSGKTVVLCHRGSGDIIINVTEIACDNLFVICENGNIDVKPTSILNVKGEKYLLANGNGADKGNIRIQDATINVEHALAAIASTSINMTSDTMGETIAKLVVLFSPCTNLDLKRAKLLLTYHTSATPAEIKDYFGRMMDIMQQYIVKAAPSPQTKNGVDVKTAIDDKTAAANTTVTPLVFTPITASSARLTTLVTVEETPVTIVEPAPVRPTGSAALKPTLSITNNANSQ